jgi:hypothetical protein
MARKTEKTNIIPTSQLAPKSSHDWRNTVMFEQQLYRVKTDANNFKIALVQAESPLIRNRWPLYQIYQNLTLDSFLNGLLRQRKDAVQQKKIFIYGPDGNINDVLTNKFRRNWFNKFLEFAHDAIFYGSSFIQITGVTAGEVDDVELVPRVYTCPEFDLIRDGQQSLTGNLITDPEYKDWIIPIYKDKYDLGELRNVCLDQISRQNAKVSFSEFQEKFGTPFRIAKTDLMNEKTRDTIAKMLSNMGGSMWAVVNKDDDLSLLQVEGDGTVFTNFLDYLDEQISICILGQALTTKNSKYGTKALGEVHQKVAANIVNADRDWLENWINQLLLPRLVDLDVLPKGCRFGFDKKDEVGLLAQLEVIEKLTNCGFNIEPSYIEEVFAMPLVKNRPIDPEQNTTETKPE